MEHKRQKGSTLFLVIKAILALWLAFVTTDVWAAVLYKLTDSRGQVTYVDSLPDRFSGRVERLDIDTTRHVAPARPDYEAILRRPAAVAQDDAAIRAARAKLGTARAALENARANPGEGDVIVARGARTAVNPNGSYRYPSEDYLARLQQLEADVSRAEAELRAAERG